MDTDDDAKNEILSHEHTTGHGEKEKVDHDKYNSGNDLLIDNHELEIGGDDAVDRVLGRVSAECRWCM